MSQLSGSVNGADHDGRDTMTQHTRACSSSCPPARVCCVTSQHVGGSACSCLPLSAVVSMCVRPPLLAPRSSWCVSSLTSVLPPLHVNSSNSSINSVKIWAEEVRTQGQGQGQGQGQRRTDVMDVWHVMTCDVDRCGRVTSAELLLHSVLACDIMRGARWTTAHRCVHADHA